jgi:superfamily II DNA/RNA helicase
VKLWTKKANEGSDINFIRWKIYKRLETSIFSFRVCLKEILDKNIEVKKILSPDADDCKLLKKEHVENIKNNFETMEKTFQESILVNIDKDIKSIENLLSNIENIRYLENKDDKITNVLKILRNENKPSLIFSESKDTVLYIERRLKEYGNFKTSVYFGNELTIEEVDPENCKELDKDRLVDMFKRGESDLFITTDLADEDVNLSRAEVIINFDIPVSPGTMLHRLNSLAKGNNPKKIKIFNFFPDKRIDKETEIFEKLNFKFEEAVCFYGMEFANWLSTQKKIEMTPANFQDIIRALNEFKEAMSTSYPENLQSDTFLEEINNNISLREFIKSYNISEDTIKFADTNYKKPVYTSFKSDEDGYFSFYVHNGNVYTSNKLVFSDISHESELGNDEIEKIKKAIMDQIITSGKNMNLLNFENDEEISEMPIGIIKYKKE